MVIQNISCFQEPSRITSREEGKHNAAQAGIGEVTRRGGCMTLGRMYDFAVRLPVGPRECKTLSFQVRLALPSPPNCAWMWKRIYPAFGSFFKILSRIGKTDNLINNVSYWCLALFCRRLYWCNSFETSNLHKTSVLLQTWWQVFL